MKNKSPVWRLYSENDVFQELQALKSNRQKRYARGEFLVEGVRNLNEAVKNGWKISSWIYSDQRELSLWAKQLLVAVPADRYYLLTPELMQKLSGKCDTSELLATVRIREDDFYSRPLSACPLIVVFDRPSNKGNLGTLLRTADAFGADCVILTGHAVDLYDPEVITAGMGSFFSVPVIRMEGPDPLRAVISDIRRRYPDFQIIATTAHHKTPIFQMNLTKPCMLLIGNETNGLGKKLYDLADETASLPMHASSSASSLNVSCAATAILYEIIRQRTGSFPDSLHQ